MASLGFRKFSFEQSFDNPEYWFDKIGKDS
jgi:hypothetical protein